MKTDDGDAVFSVFCGSALTGLFGRPTCCVAFAVDIDALANGAGARRGISVDPMKSVDCGTGDE